MRRVGRQLGNFDQELTLRNSLSSVPTTSMVAGRERFGYATILRFVPVICGAVVAMSQSPRRRHSITKSRSLGISLARALARFNDSQTDPGNRNAVWPFGRAARPYAGGLC